ncbi:peptidylprolyl isomerase [Bifidobacterium animalis subsp. animalis]|nr:peptidylprolyl isomerase [Bifidobacterium animalis subsp. animalis]
MTQAKSAGIRKRAVRAVAAMCVAATCFAFAACGNSNTSESTGNSSASSSATSGLTKIEGVKDTAKVGEKPVLEFKKPLEISNNSYAVLQEGDGAVVEPGNRVCAQGMMVDTKTGDVKSSTWESNQMDCSLVAAKPGEAKTSYMTVINGLKLNSTVAFGINDSSSNSSYLMVMTLKKQSKDLTKAEGTKVKNIPSNLPKVTNAADGKPSIDMNGYKGSDKLVVQPLIEGNGDKLESNSYAVVKYTGWLLDGKQFDSSWDRNSTFDVNMQGGVIEGWLQGLKGQKVGSEVLLVIPPSLGYGDKAQGEIPANSTLVFVVDILAKY